MFGWNQAYLVEKKFKLKAQRDQTITAVVAPLNVIFCVFSQELCITLPDKVLNSSAIPLPRNYSSLLTSYLGTLLSTSKIFNLSVGEQGCLSRCVHHN